ncbi:MAG TPA: alpha/beta hydrolase [Bacteroidales bacterium]|nr:alpha/beta hydrolase [Bacteroidales bacterium]
MRKNYLWIIWLAIIASCNNDVRKSEYYIPGTISAEARKELASFAFKDTINGGYPSADDTALWRKFWQYNEDAWMPFNDTLRMLFKPHIIDTVMGGVPVLDVRPHDWKDNGKILIYIHGGAYTLFSAYTMMGGVLPIADLTGLRVISINYTNPPRLKYNQILEQVISVVSAILKMGYEMPDIGIYGDSAGGGLSAGSVLKMRDEGMGMPAVVVLISPWSDITNNGDTYRTLMGEDPIIEYNNSLRPSSLAYAPPEMHKNPYVSPVYGDYTRGFPPTLIQGGTKEIFLSNFVRQYQAIDQAGIPVKLDLYEGMWHVFQEINYDLPESKIAHAKFRDWVYRYMQIDSTKVTRK